MAIMLRNSWPTIPAVAAAIVISLTAAATAAEPSFDCRTAKTAREVATCHDAGLAAADRAMAAAWRNAIARLNAATAKALRADQRKFLDMLDGGFESEVWGKAGPPDDASELRRQIAQLRRGPNDDTPGNDALGALEAALRERVAFLRGLTPPGPAAPYAGLWKNESAELLIEPVDGGSYRVSFGVKTFGFPKYQCHFAGIFTASDEGLVAPVAHNLDLDRDIADNVRLARDGQTLTIDDDVPHQSNGTDPYYICPRIPSLTGPLFHTGLRASEAARLKPD